MVMGLARSQPVKTQGERKAVAATGLRVRPGKPGGVARENPKAHLLISHQERM